MHNRVSVLVIFMLRQTGARELSVIENITSPWRCLLTILLEGTVYHALAVEKKVNIYTQSESCRLNKIRGFNFNEFLIWKTDGRLLAVHSE
jgi:hypothetical protein